MAVASAWVLAWVLARSSRNGRTSSWRLMSSVAVTSVTVRAAEPMRTRLVFVGGLVLDLLHEQLDTLAANLVARGRYCGEWYRAAPGKRVAIAACHADLLGDGDAFVGQRRDDARTPTRRSGR